VWVRGNSSRGRTPLLNASDWGTAGGRACGRPWCDGPSGGADTCDHRTRSDAPMMPPLRGQGWRYITSRSSRSTRATRHVAGQRRREGERPGGWTLGDHGPDLDGARDPMATGIELSQRASLTRSLERSRHRAFREPVRMNRTRQTKPKHSERNNTEPIA